MHARDILTRTVVTVRPDTPLTEAVRTLTELRFGALPVVDDAHRVVGIFSESDALAAKSHLDTAVVEAVMTVPVNVVHPGTDVSAIAETMLSRHLRSIPVVESGILVGIVARRDLLQALIHDGSTVQAEIRSRLDDYMGSRQQWSIEVDEDRVCIRGTHVDPVEAQIVAALARTVPGVAHVDVVDTASPNPAPMPPPRWSHQ